MQGRNLEVQVRAELELIMPLVSALTGLPARWSGVVELTVDSDAKGKKRFDCVIEIDALLADQDTRWPTLIHESLHCHSAGYNGSDFRRYRGWEEGVVEQLQRLLRPQILSRIGIHLNEEIFQQRAVQHRYNRYITALESLRMTLYPFDNQQTAFYIALLGTLIAERIAFVLERGFQLPFAERVRFMRDFATANDVLTRRAL